MTKIYVLLDAMGIQHYVFETNKLTIIIGSSLSLSEWQETCVHLCKKCNGDMISSAGGNVLARFSEKDQAEEFRKMAIGSAPPGMEVAWSETQEQNKLTETWKLLQTEIGRYKAGDKNPEDYPAFPIPPLEPPGCLYCGTRPADNQDEVGGRKICSICRKRYKKGSELQQDYSGNTPIEKLYQRAFELGFTGLFPGELEDLVTKVTNDKGEKDLLAVVVIDLNDMGNRVKQVVDKYGFDGDVGLHGFSKKLEQKLVDISQTVLSEMANWEDGKNEKDKKNSFLRLRPLLLGGDDIVMAMPAPLWPAYVSSIFEKLKEAGFEACAGVIVAKHTYPINRLIGMAEELVSNSKGLVRYRKNQNHDCDGFAIDWHMHQESAFNSPLAIRRRNFIPYNKNDIIEVATRKPYGFEEFDILLKKAASLKGSHYSNRKLFTLYAGLRSGTKATRDTLVYIFLRNEDPDFIQYDKIWDFVKGTEGEHPLWSKKDFQKGGYNVTLYNTDFSDVLELKLLQGCRQRRVEQ